jgi:hypothetical protein
MTTRLRRASSIAIANASSEQRDQLHRVFLAMLRGSLDVAQQLSDVPAHYTASPGCRDTPAAWRKLSRLCSDVRYAGPLHLSPITPIHSTVSTVLKIIKAYPLFPRRVIDYVCFNRQVYS